MVKRTLLIALGWVCLGYIAHAQDESDALRYSYLTNGGTARMQAIGNAQTALGGDPSSMDVNPAGIGLFRTNDFSFTPGFQSISNQASYLGSPGTDSKSNLYLQQAALIFATNKRRNSGSMWQNVTLGFGLNRLANFNNSIFYQGTNSNSSYSDNYLFSLQGETNYSNATKNYPYGPSEAVLTGLVGPEVDQNNNPTGTWASIVPVSSGIRQSNSLSTSGAMNEFTMAVAGNYANKWYLGLSLNVPSIKYDRSKDIRETNINDPNSPLNFYDVTESLHTDGVGLNGDLGLIYSANHMVRIGATFHTPTLFSMHDTYTTGITTNTKDQGTLSSTTTDITNGYPGEYQYNLTTPWRAMAGVSFIFGESPDVHSQHGFLSIDYEYVNYAAARFHFSSSNAGDKAFEQSLNQSISSMYRGGSNFKIGGEIKWYTLALRAGFDYLGSPYSDSNIQGQQLRYSAGIGLRNRGSYLDLTYTYINGHSIDHPYLVQQNSFGVNSPAPATLQSNGSQVLLTVGFKL